MAFYKNIASQKIAVFAYDSTDGSAKTGDAANISAQISIDGGAAAPTDDVAPTELDAADHPGVYLFDMTQAESNGDLLNVTPVSATGDILLEPVFIYTTPGDGTALASDTIEISGDATAANNAESFFDGTGYAGTNNVIPVVTLVSTTTTNTDMVGTDNAATAAALAILTNALILTSATIETVTSQTAFIIPATADATDDDVYIGALAVFIDGTDPNQKSYRLITDYASGTRTVTVAVAPDFTVTNSDTLTILATGTASSVWDRVLTGATHNLSSSAGRRLRNIQDFGIYDMASAWVDETAGTSTGTVDGEDATVANRADDFDNAQTVATSVGLDAIHVQNGNSITLTGALDGFNVWSGATPGSDGWTLALGSQSLANSCISGATISGICTGADPCFRNCSVGTVTIPPMRMVLCSLTATVTIGSAGNFQFIDCQSGVAGASTPTVDVGGAVGATTVEFRRWSGGLSLTNVQAGDMISVDVVSGGTITVNGTGGTVVIRGMCDVTDSSGGSVSITQTSVVNMTKVNTEADTALSDYDGPTNAEMETRTHTAAAIAKLNAAALGIVVGTVNTGVEAATTTTFQSADITEATADHFIGRIVVFYDSGDALFGQATDITDYELNGAEGKFTVTALTSAPADADKFVIL